MSISVTGGVSIPTGGGIQTTITDSNPTDPDFASVVLHLPFQNDLADVQGRSSTINGTPTITAIDPPFPGGSSVLVDRNTDSIEFADSEDWNFGTGDFTIEGWLKFTSGGGRMYFISQAGNAFSDRTPFSVFQQGPLLGVMDVDGGGGFEYIRNIAFPVINIWMHFAWARDSGTVRSFADGVLIDTAGAGFSPFNSPNKLVVSGFQTGASTIGSRWGGNLSDIRVTKGVARYTASFTPPTEALPTS